MATVTRYLGTCPVCYGEHKLQKMLVVLHGYERPGYGEINGKCPGVGWPPFEVSPDGTIAYVERRLQPDLEGSEDFLRRAEAGQVTEVRVETLVSTGWGKRERAYKTLTPADDHAFREALRRAVINTENHVRHLTQDIAERTQKVARWQKEPVRTEEEVVQARERLTDAKRAQIDEVRAAKQAKRAGLDAKQRAREQEKLDLIEEYRELFNHLAAQPDTEAVRAEARQHWVQLHKRMDKKSYLHFYPPRLEADEALIALGLAVPASTVGRYPDYAHELGWTPRRS